MKESAIYGYMNDLCEQIMKNIEVFQELTGERVTHIGLKSGVNDSRHVEIYTENYP